MYYFDLSYSIHMVRIKIVHSAAIEIVLLLLSMGGLPNLSTTD